MDSIGSEMSPELSSNADMFGTQPVLGGCPLWEVKNTLELWGNLHLVLETCPFRGYIPYSDYPLSEVLLSLVRAIWCTPFVKPSPPPPSSVWCTRWPTITSSPVCSVLAPMGLSWSGRSKVGRKRKRKGRRGKGLERESERWWRFRRLH